MVTDPVHDPSLRAEALNAHITAGYARLAEALQRRVDPGHSAEAPSRALPVWFAIAAWASREVGACLVAAGQTLDRVEALADGASADELIDALTAPLPSALRRTLSLTGLPRELAASLALAASVQHDDDDPDDDPAHLASLLDPAVFAITAARAARLLAAAPGDSLITRATSVLRTARQMLEDGNRRIYADIGLPTAAFLAAAPEPAGADAALARFTLPGADADADIVAAVRRDLRQGVIPRRFDAPWGTEPARSTALIVAGLACLDEAAVDLGRQGGWIAAGNNLLAWREQHHAVQPAFTPPTVHPGEVDRAALFAVLTPTVRLPIGARAWLLTAYAPSLPARDLNPLTPRVTEYSWAAFEDRWPCILDAFALAYRDPAAVWPLPAPDPRRRSSSL